MNTKDEKALNPHRLFSKTTWANLRADTPLTLSIQELQALHGFNDPISIEEVEQIYLPLSRLLSMHVESAKNLFLKRLDFLNLSRSQKTPFIIGIAGSVAVGKTTTARLLKTLLSRWHSNPKVDLITTDGFLYPNEVLEKKGLMSKKGFPESYDLPALLRFLSDIKTGKSGVTAPVYSHLVYDVVPRETITVNAPDILIVEGLNVLQSYSLPKDGTSVPFVSDFFDFSIYIDAEEHLIKTWYKERFLKLRQTAFQNPQSYFRQVAEMSEDEALHTATNLWETINRINLLDNIVPTRPRADLILHKGESHTIETILLRRL